MDNELYGYLNTLTVEQERKDDSEYEAFCYEEDEDTKYDEDWHDD